MKHAFVCLAASGLLISCQSMAPVAPASIQACASDASATAVADTIRSFYVALAKNDGAAVQSLTTPGFAAFEIGKHFTGPELFKLIADAQKAGRVFEWNVGPVDARIDCNLAFARWQNEGAVGTASAMKPSAWLESALLVRQGDHWVIDFLHSTPKDPRN